MTGAVAATAAVSRKTARLSGSLSASGAGPTVTSATVTWEIPGPSPRNFSFSAYVDVGVVTTLEYNKNSAGWTVIPDGTLVSFANGDTLAVRQNGCTAGEQRTFNINDQYTLQGVQSPVLSGV